MCIDTVVRKAYNSITLSKQGRRLVTLDCSTGWREDSHQPGLTRAGLSCLTAGEVGSLRMTITNSSLYALPEVVT